MVRQSSQAVSGFKLILLCLDLAGSNLTMHGWWGVHMVPGLEFRTFICLTCVLTLKLAPSFVLRFLWLLILGFFLFYCKHLMFKFFLYRLLGCSLWVTIYYISLLFPFAVIVEMTRDNILSVAMFMHLHEVHWSLYTYYGGRNSTKMLLVSGLVVRTKFSFALAR